MKNKQPNLTGISDIGRSGIGARIGQLVAIAVLTSCIVVAGLLSTFGFARSVENMRNQVRDSAIVLAQSVTQPLSRADKEQVSATLSAVSRMHRLNAVVVRNQSKEPVASMGSAAFLEGETVSTDASLWDVARNRTLAIAVPIIKGGKEIGDLIVFADVQDIFSSFLLNIAISFSAAAIAALAGLLVSKKLQRRIAEPIVNMTATIMEIRKNRNFLARVEQSTMYETGKLAESFNSLMSDIRSRDAVLEKMAYFDNMTGLRNRAGCQQAMEDMIRTGQGAVLIFDIDGFREINDALGQTMGNSVLMDVAARFHDACGWGAVASRTGGDEFSIVLQNISSVDAAMKQAARFVAAFYEPLHILAHEIEVTMSCGIAVCPLHGATTNDLLRRADLALVEAKRQGKGRTSIFNSSFEEKIHERNELISGLRAGLPLGEITPHFQPQVDLRTGLVYGFEALARWTHPVRGNVSPGLFIPVAEKAGLIPEIGREILRKSCIQAMAWFKQGKGPYQVSVNVSAAQLVQAEFLRDVQEILSHTALPPPLLCLELTESVFLGRSVGQVRHMFNDLKKMGIELALDDFGTGYSSLSYLEGLPFDKVKIDRAFVYGVHHSEKKMALLKSIIALSHSLDMRVVAEGAETSDDINALLALNADAVQGYYFAKPTAAEEALRKAEDIGRTGQNAQLKAKVASL